MQVELRHARVVAAIATAGSISKAAAQLNLPQPSLTVQLRRIERALGGDLFLRSHTGVVPTPLGERLIPMLVDLARRGDALLAEVATSTTATLRLGNVEWTPPTLREAIRAALPAVALQTETVDPLAAVDAVAQGALTVALVPNVPVPAAADGSGKVPLSRSVIVREPVWLALPHDRPLPGPEPVGAAQLMSLSWVRYARTHWFHAVEEGVFAGLPGGGPEVVHRARGHHEAMAWVRDAGVAALTTPTGATKDVRLVPVADARTSELVLLWRTGTISRTVLRKLISSVRRYYCEYARTIPGYWTWMTEHPEDFREVRPYLRSTR